MATEFSGENVPDTVDIGAVAENPIGAGVEVNSPSIPAETVDTAAPPAEESAPVEPAPPTITDPASAEEIAPITSEIINPDSKSEELPSDLQPETPPCTPVQTPDRLTSMLGSKDFSDWLEQEVFTFLGIMDIENPSARRAAIIALNAGEEGLQKKLRFAESVLHMERAFAAANGLPDLVEHAETFFQKVAGMRQWLTLK